LFMLDTGSRFTAYDVSLRPLLGKPISRTESRTADRNISLEFFQSPRASVGKLSIQTSVPVAAFDCKMCRLVSGAEIYGVLGMDFLGHQILHIDQDQGKVRFLRPGGAYPGKPIPISYSPDEEPKIELDFQSSGKERFVIDTGNGGSGSGDLKADVFRSLARSKSLELLGINTFYSTASGTTTPRAGAVHQVKLGPFTHRGLVFHEARYNLLGLSYWSRYVVTFDFHAQMAYLERSRRFALPEEVNRSGLHLLRVDGQTCVHSVDKDSPASAKGIAAEDVIVKFDGKSPDQMSLDSLRRVLSSPGKSVTIVIRRRNEERELTLELSK
jgi:hypothetical protein